jgi:hypothetical protein
MDCSEVNYFDKRDLISPPGVGFGSIRAADYLGLERRFSLKQPLIGPLQATEIGQERPFSAVVPAEAAIFTMVACYKIPAFAGIMHLLLRRESRVGLQSPLKFQF